jgi:hypothetical protein
MFPAKTQNPLVIIFWQTVAGYGAYNLDFKIGSLPLSLLTIARAYIDIFIFYSSRTHVEIHKRFFFFFLFFLVFGFFKKLYFLLRECVTDLVTRVETGKEAGSCFLFFPIFAN